MFPKNESNKLGTFTENGVWPTGIELILFGVTGAQIILLDAQIVEELGHPIGTVAAAAMTAYCKAAYWRMWHACKEGREDSPMNNYLKAKKGGWAAHLVPYHTSEGEEENTPDQAVDERDGG
jgi:hypothetical protein